MSEQPTDIAERQLWGYYWVKFTCPDGPATWQPAQWLGAEWLLIGSSLRQREITTPGASNQWAVGARIHPPVSDTA
jgi:hypothetical protein